jgi:hypothetical protein
MVCAKRPIYGVFAKSRHRDDSSKLNFATEPSSVFIVKASTVNRWHRKGFRLFWAWKVRHGKPGRPAVPKEVRALIRTMSHENFSQR